MNFKDFSSPVIDQIREAGQNAIKFGQTVFDPAEDLTAIHFGWWNDERSIRSCSLLKSGLPTGVALGGFGQEDDPTLLYLLIIFPASACNYEIICYRYSRDKFFIFRDGKLIGQFRSNFQDDLDETRQWEIMCGEETSGLIDVPANWNSTEQLTAQLAKRDTQLAYQLYPPPRFRNWMERMLFGMSAGLWSPPLQPDPVLTGRLRFRSRAEAEVYFSTFIFFRVMVYLPD